MRDQIIEVNGQYPNCSQVSGLVKNPATSYPDATFWLQVYPPLGDRKAPLQNSRMICPWSMAAELADGCAPDTRRQNILDALKKGLKTIRQYGLPPYRIMFTEEHTTRKITVWVE
jgi:hypothetical protein